MFLDKIRKLENKFGFIAISNLPLYIIGFQIIVYFLVLTETINLESIILRPSKIIMLGEYWRALTFPFVPPILAKDTFSIFLLIISWYIFAVLSKFLESYWGTFLFNVFIYIGLLGTLILSLIGFYLFREIAFFVNPDFLFFSIFIAFCIINPDYEILLFFVLPIKVKYLAYFSIAFFLFSFFFTSLFSEKISMLGQVLNLILFFAKDFKFYIKKIKNIKFQTSNDKAMPFAHKCICGLDSINNPDLQFRYKKKGDEVICVCEKCNK